PGRDDQQRVSDVRRADEGLDRSGQARGPRGAAGRYPDLPSQGHRADERHDDDGGRQDRLSQTIGTAEAAPYVGAEAAPYVGLKRRPTSWSDERPTSLKD